MADNVAEITDQDFEARVLKAEEPVLVDFWAPWCGPCKAIGPVVDELAQTYAGKVGFFKCNVDDNPSTPANYGIRAIPTLILFKGGQVVDQITGMVGRSALEKSIDNAISGDGSSRPFVVT